MNSGTIVSGSENNARKMTGQETGHEGSRTTADLGQRTLQLGALLQPEASTWNAVNITALPVLAIDLVARPHRSVASLSPHIFLSLLAELRVKFSSCSLLANIYEKKKNASGVVNSTQKPLFRAVFVKLLSKA